MNTLEYMNKGDASKNDTNTPTVLSISWTESAAFYLSVLHKIGGS